MNRQLKSTAQPGILILTPDGTVVHRMDRISTFQAGWFDHLLRAVLSEHVANLEEPRLQVARQ